ncbi:hypothetical protein FACS1894111_07710 [Clostridia bacterium]|nr:hypothetical protein FACS1894111_07710 [Clostridia bacterium]
MSEMYGKQINETTQATNGALMSISTESEESFPILIRPLGSCMKTYPIPAVHPNTTLYDLKDIVTKELVNAWGHVCDYQFATVAEIEKSHFNHYRYNTSSPLPLRKSLRELGLGAGSILYIVRPTQVA